ncbi:hypothetical protein D3C87_1306510 [compost metagenome]
MVEQRGQADVNPPLAQRRNEGRVVRGFRKGGHARMPCELGRGASHEDERNLSWELRDEALQRRNDRIQIRLVSGGRRVTDDNRPVTMQAGDIRDLREEGVSERIGKHRNVRIEAGQLAGEHRGRDGDQIGSRSKPFDVLADLRALERGVMGTRGRQVQEVVVCLKNDLLAERSAVLQEREVLRAAEALKDHDIRPRDLLLEAFEGEPVFEEMRKARLQEALSLCLLKREDEANQGTRFEGIDQGEHARLATEPSIRGFPVGHPS